MNLRLRSLSATLAIAAVAVAYVLAQGAAPRPAPRIERTASWPMVPPRMPSAREILDRRADLALTGDQAARLEELDREWAKGSAALETAIAAAQADFSRFMEGRGATQGASVQEIQRQSEAFREPSAELRRRRQGHTDAALGLLTEIQRRALAPGRSAETSGGNP